MNQFIHTVKITGHLTFDSRFPHFTSAFKHFIADPDNEGIQLQITDMVNTELPSMELGVNISIARTYNSVAPMRFAKQDPPAQPKPQPQPQAKVKKKSTEKVSKSTQSVDSVVVNPQTGSDICFY